MYRPIYIARFIAGKKLKVDIFYVLKDPWQITAIFRKDFSQLDEPLHWSDVHEIKYANVYL